MIIGLTGVSQSGKDTFCSFTNFTRLAFADVLKQQAMNALLSIGIDKDICITDCRYLSEAEMIKSLGGKIIYISRADTLPANDVERKSIREILSSGIIDYYIKNDGTMEQLEEVANELIKLIRNTH